MRERYVGAWSDGTRHGQGAFFYANGSRYEGSWERGQKVGHGVFTFEDGSVYEGPFADDKMADGQLQQQPDLFSKLVRRAPASAPPPPPSHRPYSPAHRNRPR